MESATAMETEGATLTVTGTTLVAPMALVANPAPVQPEALAANKVLLQ